MKEEDFIQLAKIMDRCYCPKDILVGRRIIDDILKYNNIHYTGRTFHMVDFLIDHIVMFGDHPLGNMAVTMSEIKKVESVLSKLQSIPIMKEGKKISFYYSPKNIKTFVI